MDEQHLSKTIASKLASYKIDERTLNDVAKRILKEKLKIKRIDLCPYGICIDYFTDERPPFDKLFERDRVRSLHVFPYGIPFDDLFHLKLELEIPELLGQVKG
jgi:hypothetical protein